ncbi:MAG: hypothetical protein CUN57_01840, partial [Phototrophicales bacterium]
IRHIYDADTGNYEPCDFENQLFSVKFNLDWNRTDFEIGYEYEITDYNRYFEEYDNEADSFLFKVTRPINRQARIMAGYEFKQQIADAIDEPGEDYRTSDDGDISYDQNIFRLGIKGFRIGQFPWQFSTEYSYRFREYTTENKRDSFHFEREDT